MSETKGMIAAALVFAVTALVVTIGCAMYPPSQPVPVAPQVNVEAEVRKVIEKMAAERLVAALETECKNRHGILVQIQDQTVCLAIAQERFLETETPKSTATLEVR